MPQVNQLPIAAAVVGTNYAIADDSVTTYRATYSQVLSYIQSTIQITESQVTNLTTDLANRLQISNLAAGTNITITNAGGITTISASGAGGFVWNQVSGTSQSMFSGNGYENTNSGLTTFTLPATSSFGDEIAILGSGSGGWTLIQNSGQSIVLGSSTTTTTTGSLSSTNAHDTIYLVCISANTKWQVTSVIGNLTVV